jgi:outer membrane protein assembly factor BamB
MTENIDQSTRTNELARKPLRLWPGVVAVAVQWLAWLTLPAVMPEQAGAEIIIAAFMGLVVVGWWLFFSRAPWSERLGAIVLMVAAVAVTLRLVHASIANGMMGFMLIVYSIPAMSLAIVAAAVASRGLSTGLRRAVIVASIVLACGVFIIIRTDGVTGDAASDLHWRWTPTAEQRLLARAADEPMVAPPPAAATQPGKPPAPAAIAEPTAPAPAVPESAPRTAARSGHEPPSVAVAPAAPDTAAAWPGFRGPERDSTIHGVRLETDWSKSPPVELWRRPVGPGWSSFAVGGDRIYTQEQRGEDEIVSVYKLKTGEPVWRHKDAARFWESNAGAGPRGTPTLSHGRVYTMGGTGIVNALDARDGSVVWSRNAATDTGSKVPDWGIASSPVVVGDVVIAAAAGSLVGYDAATGKPRWFGPKGGWGYSSPQLSTIDGVPQIVLLNGAGAIGVAPTDGTVLWNHAWPGDGIVQPAVVAGGGLLIASGSGMAANNGMLRVTVAHERGGWNVKDRWMSTALKPYFNDFVVHKDHAFGFDGSILACINLEDGQRKWKGGRYGHGQLLLLPDQDVMLVLSEEGELALVAATPDKFTELARFKAIEGKTWNHPVLVGDVLLVRNGEEMAAFRLSLAGR